MPPDSPCWPVTVAPQTKSELQDRAGAGEAGVQAVADAGEFLGELVVIMIKKYLHCLKKSIWDKNKYVCRCRGIAASSV